MGNAAVAVQFIAAIAGSGAIAGLISWVSGRRKTSAEVATLWNKLAKEQMADVDERSALTNAKNEMLIELVSLMAADLDQLGGEHADQYRARVRAIEAMRTVPAT